MQTWLNPVKIMTNTAGASDIVFDLLRLPGSQFSPQLDSAVEAGYCSCFRTHPFTVEKLVSVRAGVGGLALHPEPGSTT